MVAAIMVVAVAAAAKAELRALFIPLIIIKGFFYFTQYNNTIILNDQQHVVTSALHLKNFMI